MLNLIQQYIFEMIKYKYLFISYYLPSIIFYFFAHFLIKNILIKITFNLISKKVHVSIHL